MRFLPPLAMPVAAHQHQAWATPSRPSERPIRHLLAMALCLQPLSADDGCAWMEPAPVRAAPSPGRRSAAAASAFLVRMHGGPEPIQEIGRARPLAGHHRRPQRLLRRAGRAKGRALHRCGQPQQDRTGDADLLSGRSCPARISCGAGLEGGYVALPVAAQSASPDWIHAVIAAERWAVGSVRAASGLPVRRSSRALLRQGWPSLRCGEPAGETAGLLAAAWPQFCRRGGMPLA